MSQHEADKRLQKLIDVLPEQIQPQRDLWSGIDLALEEQGQRTQASRNWYTIAASIAVLALIAILSVNTIHEPENSTSGFGQIVSQLSQQHEQQKQFLLSGYEQQAALTDNWQLQLKELDAAASTIKAALEQDPADANLIGMLQQVYQQQIKLIQSVHQPRWM